MKKYYKKAGIPCARYHMVSTMEEGLAFIDEVGYPVIVKPDMGVGAAKTYRLANRKEVKAFYDQKPISLYHGGIHFGPHYFL